MGHGTKVLLLRIVLHPVSEQLDNGQVDNGEREQTRIMGLGERDLQSGQLRSRERRANAPLRVLVVQVGQRRPRPRRRALRALHRALLRAARHRRRRRSHFPIARRLRTATDGHCGAAERAVYEYVRSLRTAVALVRCALVRTAVGAAHRAVRVVVLMLLRLALSGRRGGRHSCRRKGPRSHRLSDVLVLVLAARRRRELMVSDGEPETRIEARGPSERLALVRQQRLVRAEVSVGRRAGRRCLCVRIARLVRQVGGRGGRRVTRVARSRVERICIRCERDRLPVDLITANNLIWIIQFGISRQILTRLHHTRSYDEEKFANWRNSGP